jgi:hypothetical protein
MQNSFHGYIIYVWEVFHPHKVYASSGVIARRLQAGSACTQTMVAGLFYVEAIPSGMPGIENFTGRKPPIFEDIDRIVVT